MSKPKDALSYRLKSKKIKKHLLVLTNLCIIKIPTDASVEREVFICVLHVDLVSLKEKMK